MTLLEIDNVTYTYKTKYQSVDALRGISCVFEEGRVYAVVGKSGSGKSTLLYLMAGLDVPGGGQVIYDGKATSGMDLNKYRRESVAVIYQDFRLFPLLTVSENITYPMELRGIKGEPARRRARELVEKVSLPESVLHRFPGMLSGGEQQRVAIARSLSTDTRIILADEPTGNLDGENGDRIIDILVKLAHEENYLIIIATHDTGILPKADVILRIVDGALA